MEKFVCPMHPEITSHKPSRCTKCGMKLVSSAKVSQAMSTDLHTKSADASYKPLIVVIGLITMVFLALLILIL